MNLTRKAYFERIARQQRVTDTITEWGLGLAFMIAVPLAGIMVWDFIAWAGL